MNQIPDRTPDIAVTRPDPPAWAMAPILIPARVTASDPKTGAMTVGTVHFRGIIRRPAEAGTDG